MKRSILGGLAGLVTWIVVVSVIDRILRVTIQDYTAAERAIQFTLPMKFARLLMAAVTSVAAGAVAGRISRSSRWVPGIVGGIVLAAFLPVHIAIWSKLPTWYHLSFLLTIIPFVILGAQLPVSRDLTTRTPKRA
jgi:NhaP-type Na+/H+ or K+/H+ antiporter